MTVAAFVVSALALALSVLTFLYARFEFRHSGPVTEVFGVWGYFHLISDEISLIDGVDSVGNAQIPRSVEVGANELGRFREWFKRYSLIGVGVRNIGRSAVTVRSVAVREEYSFEETETRPGWPSRSTQIGRPMWFVTGPPLPHRLEPKTTEYWAMSFVELYDKARECTVNFEVRFDDGSSLQTEPYHISADEAKSAKERMMSESDSDDDDRRSDR